MNENLLFSIIVLPLTAIAVSIYYRIKNKSPLKLPDGKPAFIDNLNGPARICIAISSVEKTSEGTEYTALSTHNSTMIGFKVALPGNSTTAKSIRQQITLKSAGNASDRFLHLLAYLYNTSIHPSAHFHESMTLDCVDLALLAKGASTAPSEPKQTSVWYKLFFHPDSEEEYAELFLNVHHKEGYIEIAEKDEEYRSLIISALSQ